MRSSNPIFNRSEEFNGRGSAHAGQAQAPYSDPSTWQTGGPTGGGFGQGGVQVDQRRMTIDSVVQKSAITLGVVMLTAFLTWWYIGNSLANAAVSTDALATGSALMLVGAGGAFLLSLVNSFKRIISPALVIAFAAFEGVALGAISKFFDLYFAEGIVLQAVIGTFAAFAGTLAAYKFFNIKVGNKFRTFVIAGMFGMVGLGLLSMLLSVFGISTGIFGFGAIGLLFAVIGLVLGVFMLILDFDFIENGIAAGLPERESWRAAFGLTVSLVWIYTNLLRILAILRGE